MYRYLEVVLISCLVFACVGCASQRAHIDYDTAADFSSYKTFAWAEDDQTTLIRDQRDLNVSALNLRRIRETIETRLAAQGYSQFENAEEADFLVSFTVGVRETVDADRFRTYPTGRWVYHWPYRRAGMQVEIDLHKYTEGMLAIDIYDGETEFPVWHGVERKRITGEDVRNPEEAIDEVVTTILKEFPPQ